MAHTYSKYKTPENKIIFCNEGASRAGKTQDAFHLIETFCSHAKTPLSVGVFRNTLKDCREKTYSDFKKYLYEIRGIYDRDSARCENTSPTYNLLGSTVEFRGLDDESEQKGYDIVFVNEALEIDSESKISGLKLRCTKLMIFDWNPKYTIHWIFDWENRPDIFFTKTTYKNNKHCPKAFITEIESESPWNLEDLVLPVNLRRENTENIKNKTVNKWHFEVYGMGCRANKGGLIFPNISWVENITTDCEKYFYGLDFGNTTGIYAFSQGCFNQDGLFFDCPIYGSFATKTEIGVDENSGLVNFWNALKNWIISNNMQDSEILVICDSAQPQKINDLNTFASDANLQIKFGKVRKFPGCVKWRIDILNRHRLHLVKRSHIIHEQENYAWREIHGIKIDEPIDDFNHFFDAAGYSIQYEPYLINSKK